MISLQAPNLGPLIDKLSRLGHDVQQQALEDAAADRVNEFMKMTPPRVEHGPGNPYEWQSEKQRRAFFATDGFGGGIPSQRTGAFEAGWQSTVQEGAAFVYNDAEHATFLVGMWQQRGHAADGWPRFAAITRISGRAAFESILKRAANKVISALGLG